MKTVLLLRNFWEYLISDLSILVIETVNCSGGGSSGCSSTVAYLAGKTDFIVWCISWHRDCRQKAAMWVPGCFKSVFGERAKEREELGLLFWCSKIEILHVLKQLCRTVLRPMSFANIIIMVRAPLFSALEFYSKTGLVFFWERKLLSRWIYIRLWH